MRWWSRVVMLALPLWGLLAALVAAAPLPVPYDIVYVRSPRHGDVGRSRIPDVTRPTRSEPGTDLMLLHQDGTEEVLVAGGVGGAVDPVMSFDAQYVYYAHFNDLQTINTQRGPAPLHGSDIYKIHLASRVITRLTHQEWTPTSGTAPWGPAHTAIGLQNYKVATTDIGVFSLSPCPLPGGKVMFTSNKNALRPTKGYTYPNMQLFVLDERTGIVEQVGYLNIGSALHPVVLTDGRVSFSSYETMGLRSPIVWGLWAMWPDGRNWEPLISAFMPEMSFHWSTQLSGGDIAVTAYYNQNNWGFGALYAFKSFLIGQPVAPPFVPRFGQPSASDPSNPKLQNGYGGNTPLSTGFSPVGLRTLTPFARANDQASDKVGGYWMGKVTQPSAAPANDVLLVWSSGPVNALERPVSVPEPDAGIYLLVNTTPAYTSTDLVLVKNDPEYNELQPKAVVPYQAIYGQAEPATLPWTPNDGTVSQFLPAGTPYGLIGTSTFYKRNTAPARVSMNFGLQGSEAGPFTNADIHAVRLLLMQPQSMINQGPGFNVSPWFKNDRINERLWVMGEIPLRKLAPNGTPLLDVDGNPDTSFLAKIPADHVFTFQTLDKAGHALDMSQTWHQLRPGEQRTDCGGCHAHSQVGTDFVRTAAGQPGFAPTDLTTQVPWTVEWADIQSLLTAKCPSCAGLTVAQITALGKPFQSLISALMTKLVDPTPEDIRTLAAWIDLGMPQSVQPKAILQDTTPWREWNTRPTVHLQVVHGAAVPASCPAGCTPTSSASPGSMLSVGMFAYGGIAEWTLTNTPNGPDLKAQCVVQPENPGVCVMPLPGTGQAVWTATVTDHAGLTQTRQLAARW